MSKKGELIGMAALVVAIVAGPLGAAPQPGKLPAGYGPNPLADTAGPTVELLAYDNGDVSPWLEFFTFDRPLHPKLVQLRKQYKLDELVAGAKTSSVFR